MSPLQAAIGKVVLAADFSYKIHIPEQIAVFFYDGINQYAPAIGYIIFGIEDDFLFDGIYSLDSTCVSRISSVGLFHIWDKVSDNAWIVAIVCEI